MAVWSLVVITFLIICINYTIAHGDIFNPAVLFCTVNFVHLLILACVKNYYGVELSFNTSAVILSGQIIFTVVNFLTFVKMKNTTINSNKYECQYIKVQTFWVICFIILELIVAYEMYKYMKSIVSYLGISGTLANIIGGFNSTIKFDSESLSGSGISRSALLSYGKPAVNAIGLFLMGVEVNNYFATKKRNVLVYISLVLLLFISLMGGSRGDAFRLLTALLCMIVLLKRKIQGSIRKGNTKLLFRICVGAIALVIIVVNTRGYFGRTVDNSLPFWRPIFPYVGAPIANLNYFIEKNGNLASSTLFGQETFCYLYKYLGIRLHINNWIYDVNLPFIYQNGINTGNVYTMYYMFLEDFGYWGIFPLTLIIALYYSKQYKKEINFSRSTGIINFRTILYCYMFNALVMLMFSNRFYEDLLSTSSFRIYIVLALILYLHKRGFFKRRIKIHN